MKIGELNVALRRLETLYAKLDTVSAELTCEALELLNQDRSEAARKFQLAGGDLALSLQKMRWVLNNLKERQEKHEAFCKGQDV